MNSLVGYGLSSSSESDSDGDVEKKADQVSCVEKMGDELAVVKSRNFLLEAGSTSSESDSEPEEIKSPEPPSSSPPHPQTPAATCPAALRPTLPPPSLGLCTSNKLPPPPLNTCSDSSVFANPFKAQAEQKLSALQKHVPLTLQSRPSQIGGRKVCVSYRKDGRCRFGIKCKFAHDSDLQTPVTSTDCPQPVSEETPASDPDKSHEGGSLSGGGAQNLQLETKEGEPGGQQGKKRRVGLSNTLIPPKRAMKQYAMLRDKERMNMT